MFRKLTVLRELLAHGRNTLLVRGADSRVERSPKGEWCGAHQPGGAASADKPRTQHIAATLHSWLPDLPHIAVVSYAATAARVVSPRSGVCHRGKEDPPESHIEIRSDSVSICCVFPPWCRWINSGSPHSTFCSKRDIMHDTNKTRAAKHKFLEKHLQLLSFPLKNSVTERI